MNKNTKVAKGPRTTGQTDIRTHYTDNQGVLTGGLFLHALHAVTGRLNENQKPMQAIRHIDR